MVAPLRAGCLVIDVYYLPCLRSGSPVAHIIQTEEGEKQRHLISEPNLPGLTQRPVCGGNIAITGNKPSLPSRGADALIGTDNSTHTHTHYHYRPFGTFPPVGNLC